MKNDMFKIVSGLYRAGKSSHAISRITGYSASYVINNLRRGGEHIRPPKRWKTLTKEAKEDIQQMKASGWHIICVMETHDIARTTAYRVARGSDY